MLGDPTEQRLVGVSERYRSTCHDRSGEIDRTIEAKRFESIGPSPCKRGNRLRGKSTTKDVCRDTDNGPGIQHGVDASLAVIAEERSEEGTPRFDLATVERDA